MYKNYFLLAWRNLVKRKWYSLINISGLALGVGVCMLIVLYISHELSFDNFISNGENIYRIVVERKYPGRSTSYSMIPMSYSQAVSRECPEVKSTVRLFDFLGGTSIQYIYDDKKFEEKKVLFADSTFFSVFDYEVIAGNKQDALSQPNSIVMNESTAKKYFGTISNAIGKMIRAEGENNPPLKIDAVCKDWPENSHFDFDILLSTAGEQRFKDENYVNFAAHTYALLHKNANPKLLESKFPEIIRKYAASNIAQAFAMPFEEFFKSGNGYNYYLQPLTKIHTTSQLERELKPNTSMQSIYAFAAIAFIILLLAIINFINLSTARSGERAKEVGIRKTFGSEKKSLVLQFLIESILVSVFALVLAFIAIYFLLPIFQNFTDTTISFKQLFLPKNILLFISLALGTGLIAGMYPALILSSFMPITVLKGKFQSTGSGILLRNGLVIFQFAISVILIISTLVVNNQMDYMMGNNLGYDKENTIIINRTDLLGNQTKAFKTALKALPQVINVSAATAYPGDNNYFGISWRKQGDQQPMTGRGILTDEEYRNLFDLQLKEGRYFSTEFGTDSSAVVINESAVRELGLKNPIGANLISNEPFLNAADGSPQIYKVIGVVKDYNYQSLHLPITPLVFTTTSKFNDITVNQAIKLKTGDLQASLKAIESTWSQFVKDRPFDFQFLDQTIASQYNAELRTQRIFTFFSSLAIFIACIGLLGLIAYACQQRMKEISVRKVLGASSTSVASLLSWSFLKSILISILIAFPISWYIMNKWLQDFTYRIPISSIHFLIAGGIVLSISMLTIGFTTLKASQANPIKALRAE